ncbi:MAG TPA: hypothetical protein VE035_15435 [Puia sp.]|nr:hypothetical protein [Puia sp.]
MRSALIGVLLLTYIFPVSCPAQDQPGIPDKIINFPSQFFSKINRQTANLDKDLTSQTGKYLDRLAKKEARLRRKLFRQDSAAGKRLFDKNPLDYNALKQSLQTKVGSLSRFTGNSYLPYLDSIKTSLKFLQQNKNVLSGSPQLPDQVNASLAQVSQLQNKMQVADQIKQLIRDRKTQIQQALSQFTHLPAGLQSSYQGYSKEAYYYGQQLKEYKDELSDPDKLTKRALGLLNRMPVFQQFMKEHSDLAGLFSLPGSGGYGTPRVLAGLQTRSVVQQAIQSQVAAGGPNAQQLVSQNIQSAESQLTSLKQKITGLGGGSSNMEIPDFRPNAMRTKSFLKRLEYGANVQSVKANSYFPVTSDLGLSLGYKLNDRNSLGLGMSYKIGWGKDIQHIAVTSQGLGLRSYMMAKIKSSFFATGGFEYNYQQPIYSLSQIWSLASWTRSGLVGVMKKYKINSKLNGNLQLLWDFLSYSQVPKTQAVVLRVGYGF